MIKKIDCVPLDPVFKIRQDSRTHEFFECVKDHEITIDGTRFVIKAGFRHDGASIPKLARGFINQIGPKMVWPALLHDWEYHNGNGVFVEVGNISLWQIWRFYRKDKTGIEKRARADSRFYDLLLYNGFSRIKAKLAYIAVRLAGWHAWITKI